MDGFKWCGECGKDGRTCPESTYNHGYCLEPRIRQKTVAGEPVTRKDWSTSWWRIKKKS